MLKRNIAGIKFIAINIAPTRIDREIKLKLFLDLRIKSLFFLGIKPGLISAPEN